MLRHGAQRQPRGDPRRGAARRPHLRDDRGRATERGIVVGYGFCELDRGTHYNSFALVGRGGLLGLQRKVHASDDEFFRFRQAYEWAVVDLGFCRVGTAICHDSDFFESWRILALKGAELVLLPHANRTMPAGGGELTFDGRGREETTEALLRAQAELLDGRRAAAAPRRARPRQRGLRRVLRPGRLRRPLDARRRRLRARARRVAARALGPGTAPPWVAADLDPEALVRARENPWFALRKRRPETYDELVARR